MPHGAKGHDLLDLLHTNNVAIPRAVWFLRVFGANEVVSLFSFGTFFIVNEILSRLVCATNLHITLRNTA